MELVRRRRSCWSWSCSGFSLFFPPDLGQSLPPAAAPAAAAQEERMSEKRLEKIVRITLERIVLIACFTRRKRMSV